MPQDPQQHRWGGSVTPRFVSVVSNAISSYSSNTLYATQQAHAVQGRTTHLVSSPLMQGWVLTPHRPCEGCSLPASTRHVEALVTDAVQASTSSRGSPPPRTAPMSASVRMPH